MCHTMTDKLRTVHPLFISNLWEKLSYVTIIQHVWCLNSWIFSGLLVPNRFTAGLLFWNAGYMQDIWQDHPCPMQTPLPVYKDAAGGCERQTIWRQRWVWTIMASTQVLLLQLLLFSLPSESAYMGATAAFSYKGRHPNGTIVVRNLTFNNRQHYIIFSLIMWQNFFIYSQSLITITIVKFIPF